MMDWRDRFLSKCRAQPDGCIRWTGAHTGKSASTRGEGGYPTFWLDGRCVYAHRLVLMDVTGEEPLGHDADHICGTRDCVNPDHLQWVLAADNRGRCTWRRRFA